MKTARNDLESREIVKRKRSSMWCLIYLIQFIRRAAVAQAANLIYFGVIIDTSRKLLRRCGPKISRRRLSANLSRQHHYLFCRLSASFGYLSALSLGASPITGHAVAAQTHFFTSLELSYDNDGVVV